MLYFVRSVFSVVLSLCFQHIQERRVRGVRKCRFCNLDVGFSLDYCVGTFKLFALVSFTCFKFVFPDLCYVWTPF